MKNHWFLFCCLSLLLVACGSESTSKKAAEMPAKTPSTTAIKTANNAPALAAPDSDQAENSEEASGTEEKETSMLQEGDKAAALKKKAKSKAEHLANQAKKKVNSAPSQQKEEANSSSNTNSNTKPPASQPVKESPKPTTQPIETPKPTSPTNEPKATEKPVEVAEPAPPVFNHDAWDGLLRKYVSASGNVNYKGFKKDKAALEDYLTDLQNNPIQGDWSKNQKIAYWINAYNAFTVKLIVDNYPISSITKLHGGKAWDHKWIKLGDKTYTLNNIENDILRPKYKDARVHFAVNCAAKSCPPLFNRAWTKSNVNSYYEKQAKAFINNTQFNKISADKVELSKIFEWYASDFGDLIAYLNKYSKVKINPGAKISYIEYDWKLNE